MAKILGIREQVGRWRPRGVQGVGFYEPAGTVERQFSPYDVRPLSAFGAVEPYNLAGAGRVAEIKNVLRALAQLRSDPLQTPPPNTQKDDVWKHIDLTPGFEDAWDGPTADAFVIAASRYRHYLDASLPADRRSPVAQLPVFTSIYGDEIVMGPQPTIAGLEALAQAAHRELKDSVQLNNYLQWRGAPLECGLLSSCEPPDTVVTPTRAKGRDWNPRGYTVAWRNGPVAEQYPNMVPMLDAIDVQLREQWVKAQSDSTEDDRSQRADIIIDYRKQRNDIVKQLNKGAALPACKDPSWIYDKEKGACVPRCPPDKQWSPELALCVVTLPTTTFYEDHAHCMSEQPAGMSEKEKRAVCDQLFPGATASAAMVIGGLAVALGVGGYFLFRDKRIPDMPAPE